MKYQETEWQEMPFGQSAVLIKDVCDPKEACNLKYVGLEHIEQETLRLSFIGKSEDVVSAKLKFKAGDILFGKLRPYFRKVIRPDFDGLCSTDIWVVRAKNGFDQGYLYYLMASWDFVNKATKASEGTKMPRAKWNYMEKMSYPFPPIKEQKAIAHILGTLDDKIELNRRINRTLEGMARAVFKSWFVDFDPVIDNALAAGNPIPDELKEKAARREEPGIRQNPLPPEITALFPNRFTESEMGWIPEGWEVTKLKEEFNILMGQSPPGRTYNEETVGLPFYQGRRDFGDRFPSRRVYCSEPKRIANEFDTLISVRAPVGDMNMATEKCCIGRGVAAIRHKLGSSSYTFFVIDSLKTHFLNFEGEGTVFGAITGRDLKNIDILKPHALIVEIFHKLVSPTDEMVFSNHKEMFYLTSIRDALLPKLISGQIQVGKI